MNGGSTFENPPSCVCYRMHCIVRLRERGWTGRKTLASKQFVLTCNDVSETGCNVSTQNSHNNNDTSSVRGIRTKAFDHSTFKKVAGFREHMTNVEEASTEQNTHELRESGQNQTSQ